VIDYIQLQVEVLVTSRVGFGWVIANLRYA